MYRGPLDDRQLHRSETFRVLCTLRGQPAHRRVTVAYLDTSNSVVRQRDEDGALPSSHDNVVNVIEPTVVSLGGRPSQRRCYTRWREVDLVRRAALLALLTHFQVNICCNKPALYVCSTSFTVCGLHEVFLPLPTMEAWCFQSPSMSPLKKLEFVRDVWTFVRGQRRWSGRWHAGFTTYGTCPYDRGSGMCSGGLRPRDKQRGSMPRWKL